MDWCPASRLSAEAHRPAQAVINADVCSLGAVSTLLDQFAARARLPEAASLRQVANAVQALPYGRPVSRTTHGVLSEWKGTCSTKHACWRSWFVNGGQEPAPGWWTVSPAKRRLNITEAMRPARSPMAG